jgi:hypothetical protein
LPTLTSMTITFVRITCPRPDIAVQIGQSTKHLCQDGRFIPSCLNRPVVDIHVGTAEMYKLACLSTRKWAVVRCRTQHAVSTAASAVYRAATWAVAGTAEARLWARRQSLSASSLLHGMVRGRFCSFVLGGALMAAMRSRFV